MGLQAGFWGGQRRFEEAKSEALRALDVFEKLGETDLDLVTPGGSDDDGELLGTVLHVVFIGSLSSGRVAEPE